MKNPYAIKNPIGTYFVTFTVVRWLNVFTSPVYKEIFLDSLKFYQESRGLNVNAYVIMTNHVHIIYNTGSEKFSIADITRDLKRYTSKRILEEIRLNPKENRKSWLLKYLKNDEGKRKFWISGSHSFEIYSRKMALQKVLYIHNNPVKKGFCFSPEQYVYSSALNYAGSKGLIDIELLY